MPIGITSPARNLFLLGSSGAQVVSNFFKQIDQASSGDFFHTPSEIRYSENDEKFVLAGSGVNSNSNGFGWIEKRDDAGVVDFENRIESTQNSTTTTLRAMELDSNGNLIAVGFSGTAPWIAKYSNDGVLDWQSTTNSANVRYLGITSDSNSNYYACGRTSYAFTDTQAFVEKFDSNGNPGWGKSAFMLGRDVVLGKISANDRGEVVAVGFLEDDSADKGYIVKIDTNTGEVLWDRTLELNIPAADVKLTGVDVDNNDEIYVCGNIKYDVVGQDIVPVDGFIAKYTAEGNLLWQSQSDYASGTSSSVNYEDITVDNTTKKPTTFGYVRYAVGDSGTLISRYDPDGALSWRREIDEGNSFDPRNTSVDGDQSFIYLLFNDTADSETYVYGKVSATGNGLGDFEYDDGTGAPLLQYITSTGSNGSNIGEKIGRLSDGSVRNDTSDLLTYPFNANKILFDDLATQVANKKRQMDSAGSFEYSGSPAIRPADFQELNLLGNVIPTNESFVQVSNELKTTTTDGASGDSLRQVAVGNDRIIAGVPLDDDNGNNSGSAYIFNLNGNQLSKLTASDGAASNFFGDAVAVGSNKIVVGAYSATVGSNINQGAAYIYDLDGTNEIKITASDGAQGDRFGYKVAVGDNTIAVSASFADAIYIFDLTGNQLNKITNVSASSVAIGSNKIVVGDGGDDTTANNAGAVHTYDLDGTNKSTIYASDGAASDFFGSSVAVGNDKIVVGSDAGAAYIYDLDGSNEVIISAPGDAASDADFANSVAVGNGKIVVGARFDRDNGFQSGSVYIYDLNGNRLNKITASDGAAGDSFGRSVAIGNNRVVIIASGDNSQQGAAYIYPIVYSAIDQSGKGNDGVVDNVTQNASGYWEFDVEGAKITLSNVYALGTEDFTFEFWFRAASAGTGTWQYFFTNKETFGGPFTRIGIHNTTNQLRFYTEQTDQSNVQGLGVADVLDDTWHQAMFVRSGTGCDIYLDGALDNSVSCMGGDIGNAVDDWIIGAQSSSGLGRFNGDLGEFRFYPRALTAAQVFQNYNATKSKYINEAPDTAPKISSDAIVYDNNLLLNYDFGNRATYDRVENLYKYSNNFDKIGSATSFWSGLAGNSNNKQYMGKIGPNGEDVWQFNLIQRTGASAGEASFQQRILPNYPAGTVTSQRWLMRSAPGYGTQTVYHKHGRNAVYGVNQANVEFDITEEWSEITTTDSVFTGSTKEFFGIGTVNAGVVVQIASAQLWIGSENAKYVDTYGVRLTAPTKVKNLSSTNFPGTLNGVTFNSAGYFDFDGVDDEITIPYTSNLAFTNALLSCEAWVYVDTLVSLEFSIINKRGNNVTQNNNRPYTFGVNSDGRVRWILDGATTVCDTAVGLIQTGQWYHLAATHDGTDAKIYVNGIENVSVTSGTSSLNNTGNIPTRIGWRYQNSSINYSDGQLGELRVYDKALTATEVSQNFNATRSKYGV